MKPLTPEEKRIILDKGTERPFSGKFLHNKEKGTYICRQCASPLYRSEDKFDSMCGWPSFDDEIPGAVKRTPDSDGHRTEITCARCGAHLGHVFIGEGFTPKNTRHCVNSISMDFIPDQEKQDSLQTAYFAGGCFWGVEYFLKQVDGVVSTEVGYMGGKTDNPSYREVCEKDTGHAETVKVTFDPARTDFETLARFFFEIHDPTQIDRQGPDIGNQYRSEIFYTSPEQKQTAERLIEQLRKNGYRVSTRLTPASDFYPGEEYHQDYYSKKGSFPYCHGYINRF